MITKTHWTKKPKLVLQGALGSEPNKKWEIRNKEAEKLEIRIKKLKIKKLEIRRG